MASTTTAIRTAYGSILTIVLSAVMQCLPPMFMTAKNASAFTRSGK